MAGTSVSAGWISGTGATDASAAGACESDKSVAGVSVKLGRGADSGGVEGLRAPDRSSVKMTMAATPRRERRITGSFFVDGFFVASVFPDAAVMGREDR